jgi:hypothetical protein
LNKPSSQNGFGGRFDALPRNNKTNTLETNLSWKQFVIEIYRISKGTLAGKFALGLLALAASLLGAAPWWSSILIPITEKYFSITVADPSVPLGVGILIVAIVIVLVELSRQHKLNLRKADGSTVNDEMRATHADDAFFRFRAEAEKGCFSILRRLISIHAKMYQDDSRLAPIADRVTYGDESAVIEYVDSIVVGNVPYKAKLDFLQILGDGTGQPLAYKFVHLYEGLIAEADERGRRKLISGTPLYQAFSNLTHANLLAARKQAFWRAYVK